MLWSRRYARQNNVPYHSGWSDRFPERCGKRIGIHRLLGRHIDHHRRRKSPDRLGRNEHFHLARPPHFSNINNLLKYFGFTQSCLAADTYAKSAVGQAGRKEDTLSHIPNSLIFQYDRHVLPKFLRDKLADFIWPPSSRKSIHPLENLSATA